MENPGNTAPPQAPVTPKPKPKIRAHGLEPGTLHGRPQPPAVEDPDADILAEVAQMSASDFKTSRFMKGPHAAENFEKYRQALARKGRK